MFSKLVLASLLLVGAAFGAEEFPLELSFRAAPTGPEAVAPIEGEKPLKIQALGDKDSTTVGNYKIEVKYYDANHPGTKVGIIDIRITVEDQSVFYQSNYVRSLEDAVYLFAEFNDKITDRQISYYIRNAPFWAKVGAAQPKQD